MLCGSAENRKSFHDHCLLPLAGGKKRRKDRRSGIKCDLLGCSLIALFGCSMFCLLSDGVPSKTVVPISLPAGCFSSWTIHPLSFPSLNLLDPFTAGLFPNCWSDLCLCGQSNLFRSFSVLKRTCSLALLLWLSSPCLCCFS